MKKLLLITVLAAAAALVPAAAANAAAAPAGQQRLIVTLALPANATTEQITSTTNSLLASLPAGDYTLNNTYSTLPYVALSAGPSALSVLQQSGLVAAIASDGVVSASSTATKCKTVKSSKKKHGKAAKKKKCAKPAAVKPSGSVTVS
jgi:hypothetical protein